jgi:hypothetical protein
MRVFILLCLWYQMCMQFNLSWNKRKFLSYLYFDFIQYFCDKQRKLVSSCSIIVPKLSKFLRKNIDIHDSINYKWTCFSVLEHKMTCTQRVKWQSMGTTKWDIRICEEGEIFCCNISSEIVYNFAF